MLESKINIIKERLWPAGIVALVLHGLMIAAMAFGTPYPQGASSQDFRAEVMFESEPEKGTRRLLTSPLVGEVDSERREEAGEGYLSLEKKHQGENPSATAYSSSTTQPHLRAGPSRKERGKKPVESTGSISSAGGHHSGQADATPIFNPPPIYPYEAKRKGLQGIVLVRLSLTEAGAVHKAITLPPRIDPLLEDAALSAIYTWRFKPGSRTLEVPIEFKLEA